MKEKQFLEDLNNLKREYQEKIDKLFQMINSVKNIDIDCKETYASYYLRKIFDIQEGLDKSLSFITDSDLSSINFKIDEIIMKNQSESNFETTNKRRKTIQKKKKDEMMRNWKEGSESGINIVKKYFNIKYE